MHQNHYRKEPAGITFCRRLMAVAAVAVLLLYGAAMTSAPAFAKRSQSNNASNDVDFGPYMAAVQSKVKRHWFPPKQNASDRVVAQWKIHTDGTVSDIKLVSESNHNEKAEAAAMKAIADSSPFRPLPAGAPSEVDVQFTFDYNVFNGEKKAEGSRQSSDGSVQGQETSSGTDSTTRVNNLANLEALLNIIANGCEIQLICMSSAVGMAGVFLLVFVRGRRVLGGVMVGLAPFILAWGLAIPGVINWLVASARDANLFS